MVAPTLAPEQWQYTDTGILLNSSPALPFVDIINVDGVDSASVRTSTAIREGTHGGWVDAQFEDVRTVTLDGVAYANPSAMEAYLDQLKANMAPTAAAQPLYFGVDAADVTRMFLAKSLGLRYQKTTDRGLGRVELQVQFLCEDPRIYAPALTTQAIPGTLMLAGNRGTTGTITITGPSTNPSITIGGKTLAFNYTLASGHSIVIDLDARTVILDGTTNLRGSMTVTGGWPKLQAGANVFTGSAASVSARAAWR